MRPWLITASVIYGLVFIPSLGMAMMSPMLFDAPGSLENRMLWVVFYSIMGLPLSIFVALPCMWIAYKREIRRGALLFSLLPVADALIMAVAFALVGNFVP